jgi:hypothetical protein
VPMKVADARELAKAEAILWHGATSA